MVGVDEGKRVIARDLRGRDPVLINGGPQS
jgi:hypothetical protein